MAKDAEPVPWTRVAAVLAEAAGVDETRSFDAQAREVARQMRGIRFDWAGRPTCTWSAAAELLASLRAEQARVVAEAEERLVAAAQERLASIPRGIPAGQIPEGMTGGLLMMAADPMPGSRRRSVVEDALQNDGALIYTPINEDAS
jgi:hypothetical protein